MIHSVIPSFSNTPTSPLLQLAPPQVAASLMAAAMTAAASASTPMSSGSAFSNFMPSSPLLPVSSPTPASLFPSLCLQTFLAAASSSSPQDQLKPSSVSTSDSPPSPLNLSVRDPDVSTTPGQNSDNIKTQSSPSSRDGSLGVQDQQVEIESDSKKSTRRKMSKPMKSLNSSSSAAAPSAAIWSPAVHCEREAELECSEEKLRREKLFHSISLLSQLSRNAAGAVAAAYAVQNHLSVSTSGGFDPNFTAFKPTESNREKFIIPSIPAADPASNSNKEDRQFKVCYLFSNRTIIFSLIDDIPQYVTNTVYDHFWN